MVRFCLLPIARPELVAYAEVPMSVCHIDYLRHEMVWTSRLVHQLGPVGGGWFWGMGVGAYVHSTHSFPSPTFLQPPLKTFCLYLEATIGKRVGPQELWVTMSKGWKEGGTALRARGILISLRYENMGVCLSFARLSYRFLFVSQTRSLGRAR